MARQLDSVANCTTPANYFHILRRQIHRTFRKPLSTDDPKITAAPQNGSFQARANLPRDPVFTACLWDDAQYGNSDTKLVSDKKIKRVVICSGKVYYDLLEERDARGSNDVYLTAYRTDSTHSPLELLNEEVSKTPKAQVVWCQEEPKNQGAWIFIEPNIEWVLTRIGAKHARPSLRSVVPHLPRPQRALPRYINHNKPRS